jgi:hypothetical protein
MRLGGPQSRSARCGKEKNLALPEIEPGPFIPYLVAIPTELTPPILGRYSVQTLDGLLVILIEICREFSEFHHNNNVTAPSDMPRHLSNPLT